MDAVIQGQRLTRLDENEIKALRTGDTRVVRLTRLYEPEPKVVYEGAAILYVQMAERKVKGGKRGQVESVPVTLTLKDKSWADYALEYHTIERMIEHGEYGNGHCLVVEDYMMEIFKPAAENDQASPANGKGTPATAVPVTELMRQFYEASKDLPDDARFILIGAGGEEVLEAEQATNNDSAMRQVLDAANAEQVRVVTTPLFWDCECENDYIHLRGMLPQCPVCHADAEEMPDARVNETLAMLDAKIAQWQSELDGGMVKLPEAWKMNLMWFKALREQVAQGG